MMVSPAGQMDTRQLLSLDNTNNIHIKSLCFIVSLALSQKQASASLSSTSSGFSDCLLCTVCPSPTPCVLTLLFQGKWSLAVFLLSYAVGLFNFWGIQERGQESIYSVSTSLSLSLLPVFYFCLSLRFHFSLIQCTLCYCLTF